MEDSLERYELANHKPDTGKCSVVECLPRSRIKDNSIIMVVKGQANACSIPPGKADISFSKLTSFDLQHSLHRSGRLVGELRLVCCLYSK